MGIATASASIVPTPRSSLIPASARQGVQCQTPYRRPRLFTKLQTLRALYDWITWGFLTVLIASQFAGIVWNSTTAVQHFELGQTPLLGTYDIVGTNDIPYRDRAILCVLQGRLYRPMAVREAIKQASVANTTIGGGYRVAERSSSGEEIALDSGTYDEYSDICDVIESTLEGIVDACSALGYNVTRLEPEQRHVHVVDGLQSEVILQVDQALPVVILPYTDNSVRARYAMPSLDGSACVFRLLGKYADSTVSMPLLRAATRDGRQAAVIKWLQDPGGVWRHGWYEAPSGSKWFSEVATDATADAVASVVGLNARYYDTQQRRELDCELASSKCARDTINYHWGDHFAYQSVVVTHVTVAIGDGTGHGLFWYQGYVRRTITSVYDWRTFVANGSILMILARWSFVMLTLHSSYYTGVCPTWHGAGLGCVASTQSFLYLPMTLLPRLNLALASFWSAGCQFEGTQVALAETWFAMYPSIASCLLLYYSLLNHVARVLRRRMTDALFAPSLLLLSAMHFFRMEIAASGWFGLDGRVATTVFSDEVNRLQLHEFFNSDLAVRMNGNATILVAIKLAILGLNLLPLLVSKPLPILRKQPEVLAGVERALGVRANNVGGIGQAPVYIHANSAASAVSAAAITPAGSRQELAITGYELVRLGYVIYGGRYVISFEDWDIVSSMALLRNFQHLWNHRVLVFFTDARDNNNTATATSTTALAMHQRPAVLRMDDPRLLRIPFWQLSTQPIKC